MTHWNREVNLPLLHIAFVRLLSKNNVCRFKKIYFLVTGSLENITGIRVFDTLLDFKNVQKVMVSFLLRCNGVASFRCALDTFEFIAKAYVAPGVENLLKIFEEYPDVRILAKLNP